MVWSQMLPHLTEVGRMEFDILIERLLDSFTPKEKMNEEGNNKTTDEKNETKDNPIIH